MLLAVQGAMAQTAAPSVELYGTIDLALGHVAHSLSTDGNYANTINAYNASAVAKVPNSVTGMINGGIDSSRWGLRGGEDLGGGFKVFYTLESGFNPQTGVLSNSAASLASNSPNSTTVSSNGSQNGQLFNRQASVGLADDKLGSIAFGRVYNTIYDVAVDYDPLYRSQTFSVLGESSAIGGGGGISENARLDNSVKYKVKLGSVNVGALYKFGGVAGNASAGSGYVLNVGYDEGPFGIQGVYEAFTDSLKGATSSVAGEVGVTNYDETAFIVAAKYRFGQATLKGGYESYTLKVPSDPVAAIGATYYGYTIASAANFSGANQTTAIWFIGGDYGFTPAINLALGVYDQNPKASSDGKQLDGNIYSYAALLDYHFSKRTDVYSGWLYSSYKGANYSAPFIKTAGGDNASNYIFAFGIRTKF